MPCVIHVGKAAAALLLLASPAVAIDGEILVNQAKVDAGGITPGDAPGFPATFSRSGRYKLTGNLAVPAGGDGIKATQNNVTIDLNGFTIGSNPPREAFHGVFADNVTSLRVMNGTITGFEVIAIDTFGVVPAFAVVENMRIAKNARGVTVQSDSRVFNSTIADNDGFGVFCSSRCVIERNVVAGNGGTGIFMSGTGTVLGNLIVSNGSQGLFNNTNQIIGYGSNVLFGNNGGGAQVTGDAAQLHPNVCVPACP